MKNILLGLLIFSSTLFSIEWVKDLDTAFALAKKEHKNIMILVEGENCRWCKKFKHRTLADEDVEKRLEKFVVVKVMREDPSATSVLPPIEGVPTVFFMNENKTVTETILGYHNVRKFSAALDSVEKK